jgi:hypothetical protein
MIKELVESAPPCTQEHESITVELQLTRIHFIQQMMGDNASTYATRTELTPPRALTSTSMPLSMRNCDIISSELFLPPPSLGQGRN